MIYYTFALQDTVTFMLGGIFSSNPGWRHHKRFHPGDYELIICMEGPIYLTIGKKHYSLSKGDALIVPPFEVMVGNRASEKKICFYWLHFFMPKSLKTCHGTSVSERTQRSLSSDSVNVPQLMHINNPDLLIILIHRLLNQDTKIAYGRRAADYYMTLILMRMSAIVDSRTIKSSDQITVVNHVKEWLRVNLYRSPTVSDIAMHFGFNPQYFSRLFKKVTGVPPKQYLTKLQVETAQALLVRSTMSVKEVATNAYFHNEKVFLRVFKRECGLTPTQFRNQFKTIYHNNQTISPVLPIPEEITKHLEDIQDVGRIPVKKHSR